ncbi:hypothetical protein MEA186_36019 [Mesorhizobium amorphae CCNWGS0123]|uniref:Uncharacterized protein n=1 Tax=Mesorhizobium amorphae CCNWGS0123 TaxID=1082933 RepID=G6YME6_9HYPH|nr:hypothetical protein MEA186_36019 [Mesorhizobium amorphae CCNWGS0123]
MFATKSPIRWLINGVANDIGMPTVDRRLSAYLHMSKAAAICAS